MMDFITRSLILGYFCILLGCTGEKNRIELYPVQTGEYWQYIDADGNVAIDRKFCSASLFREGLAVVSIEEGNDAYYGYIDRKGDFVIPARYSQATCFNEGLAWVVLPGDVPQAINTSGEVEIVLDSAFSVSVFFDEMALFSVIKNRNAPLFGYINKKGEIIVMPQYIDADLFSHGLAAVRTVDGKWGFIDRSGAMVIPALFEKDFNRVDYDNPYESGNLRFDSNQRAIVQVGGKCGLIGRDGKYIVTPRFDAMSVDGNNYMVRQGKKWGWCDEDGHVIIDAAYDAVRPFNGFALAPVLLNGKWGFIDKKGKAKIMPQYENAVSFTGKVAVVQSDNKIGFVNGQGELHIPLRFYDISDDVYCLPYGYSSYLYVQNERLANTISGTSVYGESQSTDN